jgi:hypothetical protein
MTSLASSSSAEAPQRSAQVELSPGELEHGGWRVAAGMCLPLSRCQQRLLPYGSARGDHLHDAHAAGSAYHNLLADRAADQSSPQRTVQRYPSLERVRVLRVNDHELVLALLVTNRNP